MRRFLLLTLTAAAALLAQPDPPSRVARLNYVNGAVSYRPDNVEEWSAATINYPLTIGDHLWVDQNSGAEIHIGATALRLAANTAFTFLNLDDRTVQISLTDGFLNVTLRDLQPDESFEVDTPDGAITLRRPGTYRIDVSSAGNSTIVNVRQGEAEVAGAQPVSVQSGQSVRLINNGVDLTGAAPADEWDRWCEGRDRAEDRAAQISDRYVPREMAGSEDLATHGVWREDPSYGAIWTPANMGPDWAPYRYGHWANVRPWGWTWIDDASWGFAPFHYGRWVMTPGGWAWVPGGRAVRPVYAPALVAWVGGASFGAGVAWFPLGPREAYRPAYRRGGVQINVTNVNYVNRSYVTVVNRGTFESSRPVHRDIIRVSPGQLRDVRVVDRVNIEPRRDAMRFGGRPAAAPPAAIVRREVVVRREPAPNVSAPVRVARPAERPVERAVDRPVDRQRYERPTTNVERPRPEVVRPAERPAERPVGRPVDRQRYERPAPNVERPRPEVVRPAERPVERPVERPRPEVVRPAERPVERPVERPRPEVVRPAERPVERPVERPRPEVVRPAERPVERPAERPAERQRYERPATNVERPRPEVVRPAERPAPAQRQAEPAKREEKRAEKKAEEKKDERKPPQP